MLTVPRSVVVWAYPEPADMRKGYNGLYALVMNGLGRDPLSGELFVFANKTRTLCKVLMWDGTGLCIFMKRLERGGDLQHFGSEARKGPRCSSQRPSSRSSSKARR